MSGEFLHFEEIDSTYSYVARHAAELPHGAVVLADFQSAGRGQRGNVWESAPGENLLMAMLVRPERLAARSQFFISEAVSLAIVDTLRVLCGVDCCIKWPNDIYAGDGKICGILISHSLQAPDEQGFTAIGHTVIGVGVNLNQRKFVSNAPNPVSVAGLTGRNTDVAAFARALAASILQRLEPLRAGEEGFAELHRQYMSALYRADGQPHRFYDVQSGQLFNAAIYAVEPSGHLILRTHPSGSLRRYAFKEVSWR